MMTTTRKEPCRRVRLSVESSRCHLRRMSAKVLHGVVAAVAAVLVGSAAPLHAQVVSGIVRDSATGHPIAGAVVIQLDAQRKTVARNSTNAEGRYSTTLSAGVRIIRVVHIGFRAREFE